MDTELFNYELPRSFIAQKPSGERDLSKLMVLDRKTGAIRHRQFRDITEFFNKDDVLVINDSKVFSARIECKKEDTEGAVRFLLVRQCSGENRWEAIIEKGKSLKEGMDFDFYEGRIKGTILKKSGSKCVIDFSGCSDDFFEELDKHTLMPLPPYIKRNGNNGHSDDRNRYQTVYAKDKGSIAAPTAGLHFSETLLNKIEDAGVSIVRITLRVGIGTFIPVKADCIENHKMEEEEYVISKESASVLNESLNTGKRIIAVGTTTARALENEFAENGDFDAGMKKAGIFIIPGHRFRVINALITNFHLPASTLLALVSAFCGREKIMSTYECAKKNGYRFYSYGDAMFIV